MVTLIVLLMVIALLMTVMADAYVGFCEHNHACVCIVFWCVNWYA